MTRPTPKRPAWPLRSFDGDEEGETGMNRMYDWDAGAASGDSVDTYLRQMAAVPLLSAAEEIALATRIAEGRAAARAIRDGVSTAELERHVLEGAMARHAR
jgi:hypothetical protein